MKKISVEFLCFFVIIDLQKEMLFMFLDREKMQEKQTKEMLFERQKQTLDSFLERNAISKEQYDMSLKTLKEKLLKESQGQRTERWQAVHQILWIV